MTTKTKTPVEGAVEASPITRVLTNFEVEDNTAAPDVPEEAPVEATEKKLDTGLTLVSYV